MLAQLMPSGLVGSLGSTGVNGSSGSSGSQPMHGGSLSPTITVNVQSDVFAGVLWSVTTHLTDDAPIGNWYPLSVVSGPSVVPLNVT